MKQTRLESLVEALTNVVIGFGLNYIANFLILPTIGCHPSASQNFHIGVWFTIVSVVRSYTIRRWFNAHLANLNARIADAISNLLTRINK